MVDDLDGVREALEDRYSLDRLLGQGGMATVYLAHDLRHDRRVAIKLLRPELAQSIGLERFAREIGIAARLNHPHILPLLDSGTLDPSSHGLNTAYYVMPYVEGESLRDRLDRGKLSVDDAVRLAREVADALDHAHRHGVVHRDIKPENILLSDGHAVVADFGIARALDEAAATSGPITRTGQSIGTPAYMSPEQVLGDQPIDGRTDTYSLGCTLFEMLTGKPPWSDGPATAMLARRLVEPPPRVRAIDPSIPAAVDEALVKAMAREVDQRFETPAAFAVALENTTGSTRRAPGRRAGAVAAGIVLLAAAFGVNSLLRSGRTPSISAIAIAPETPADTTRYLSEGVLDAVSEILRKLPGLRIIAPSLVAQVQRQEPQLNVAELGERLHVGAMLTWNLRRSGDSLLLNAELLRVPGGALMWHGRYRRSIDDVLILQTQVARSIADSLHLQLTGADRATLEQPPTTSASAFELYLRGRHLYTLATPPGARGARLLLDSVRYFADRAMALDPGFIKAQSLIANYHWLSAVRGFRTPFSTELDTAVALSKWVLARDSSTGEAWGNLVGLYLYFRDDWESAKRVISTSLAHSPTHPYSWNYAAIFLGEVEGQLDSAIVLSRRAAELDPTPQTLNTLGDLYMRARQYDSAVVVLRRGIAMDSSVSGPRQRLVTVFERLGRFADAVAERRSWQGEVAAAPFAEGASSGGAAGYRVALETHLRARIDTLKQQVGGPRQYPRDTLPPLPETRIALLYGQLEDWKAATDWVLREYERRPKRFRLWLTHPDMQGLRRDPRFLELIRREGLDR